MSIARTDMETGSPPQVKRGPGTLPKWIIALAILSLTIVGMSTAWVLYNVRVLTHQSQWVSHTHEVIEQVAQVLSLLRDVGTGTRGYAVNTKDDPLEPHRRAEKSLPASVAQLKALMADNPAQLARIDRMEPLIRQRIEICDTLIAKYSNGPAATPDEKLFEANKSALASIRHITDEMEAEERRLLDLRAGGAQQAAMNVRISIMAGSLWVLLLLAVMLFIARRRIMEQQMEVALESARASSQAKSEFLANMSHEIRTPMNGVLGMADLLLATRLDDQQTEFATTIKNCSEALLTVLNDILDFSKMEAGKLTLEKIDFDLRATLEPIVDVFTSTAKSKNLQVAMLIHPEVPNLLRGDPGRIRQVLLNLVGNALKFTQHGEVVVRVVNEKVEGQRVTLRFTVSDTGIGMDRDTIARLFMPFMQADSSTTRIFGGTGLGLSISWQIIQLAKGRIGVESTPGKGSTFWFVVPFELGKAPAARPWALPESNPKNAREAIADSGMDSGPGPVNPKRSTRRILLVEDNPVNQRVATLQLQSLGYDPQVLGDGAAALAAMKEGQVDLVLLDCQIPVLDGYQVAAQHRLREAKTGKRLPIVAITADAIAGTRERCLAAGMDGYLTKPVKVEELARCIRQWIDTPAPESTGNTQAAAPGDELAQIRAYGQNDPAAITELLKLYRDETQRLMTEIEAALAGSNDLETAKLAHKLVGSNGMCGMTHMAQLSRQFEQMLKAPDGSSRNEQESPGSPTQPELWAAMRTEWSRIKALITAEYPALPK